MGKAELHFSRLFDRMLEATEQAGLDATKRLAAEFDRESNRRIRQATGGDGKISGTSRATGVRRRSIGPPIPGGAPILTKVKSVRKTSSGSNAVIESAGPLAIIEGDVAKHIVTSRHISVADYTTTTKTGKTRKGRNTVAARSASVLFGNGAVGGGRRAVLHWGNNYARFTFASSPGRHPWNNTMTEMGPKLGVTIQQAHRDAYRKLLP